MNGHQNKTEAQKFEIKGIIFDIKKFAVHDGPGIRSTVFFKGCPMYCWWCHNPESQEKDIQEVTLENGDLELIGREVTIEEVMNELLKDRIFYEESEGGVTFSGGEPLYQPEFLLELLKKCKEENLHTILDTAGCESKEVLDKVLDYVDLFLYDLKLIDNEKHLKYTGHSNRDIITNLQFLSYNGKHIVVRIPVIPGINDTQKDLQAFGEFLQTIDLIQVELLPFHKIGERKYSKLQKVNRMKDIKEPTKEHLVEIKEYLKSFNLKVLIEES
jgi:pyruvate formate lyase activating enzyme